MAIVKVSKDRYTVDSLYQYDYNQDLIIYGLSLPSIPEIHFSNSAVKEALVKQATLDNAGVVRVDIPNEILTYPHNIDVYVGVYEGDAFRVWYSFTIPVKPKKKPAEFITPDDETVHSFNALENRLLNMEKSNNSFKTTITSAWNTFKSNVESTVTSLKDAFNEKVANITSSFNELTNNFATYKTSIDSEVTTLKSDLTEHESATNPHRTTASDVGAVPIERMDGEFHRTFPNGTSTTSTMAEIYDACQNGITMLPPAWGCASYSPDGKNHMWQIVIFKSSHLEAHYEYVNAIGMYDGRLSVYNRDKNRWVGFLPLTGGTLSAYNLYLCDGYTDLYGDSDMATMMSMCTPFDKNNRREIRVRNSNAITSVAESLHLMDVINGSLKWYKIYGEHNKPSGSYVGNGSTTERTINVGGIGTHLLMHCGEDIGIIGFNGAVVFQIASSTTVYLKQGEINFRSGVLTVKTNNTVVNGSGRKIEFFLM